MKEKHKVIMLPTDDITDIIVPTQGVGKGVIHFREYYGSAVLDMNDKYQHLYFISDEEIKKGGWFYNSKSNNIFYNDSEESVPKSDTEFKIIATTDTKLINKIPDVFSKWNLPQTSLSFLEEYVKQGVPQIPQSFVKEFVKQGGIDEVELEYDYGICTSNFCYQDKCKDICTRPKLTPNNKVIVNLIEEKMYTLAQVVEAYNEGHSEASGKCCGPMNATDDVWAEDWIKENL